MAALMMAMATAMATITIRTKVKEGKAVVSGTNTLIGSIATLLSSVQRFFICDLHRDWRECCTLVLRRKKLRGRLGGKFAWLQKQIETNLNLKIHPCLALYYTVRSTNPWQASPPIWLQQS